MAVEDKAGIVDSHKERVADPLVDTEDRSLEFQAAAEAAWEVVEGEVEAAAVEEAEVVAETAFVVVVWGLVEAAAVVVADTETKHCNNKIYIHQNNSKALHTKLYFGKYLKWRTRHIRLLWLIWLWRKMCPRLGLRKWRSSPKARYRPTRRTN